MKTKLALIGMFLSLALTIQLSGQDKAKTAMLDEPTFEKKTDGLDLKVWIVDQKDKTKMAMRDDKEGMHKKDTSKAGMGMSRGTDMHRMGESMMGGTHHIMIQAKESKDGKEIKESPKILITSPSKKATSIQLKSMGNNYGGSLTLDEKGEYEFSVSVNVNGVPEVVPFMYTVK